MFLNCTSSFNSFELQLQNKKREKIMNVKKQKKKKQK